MIDYSLLQKDTIKELKKAGWRDRRKLDVSKWIKQLVSEGFNYFPYAGEVLEKFGKLTFRPKKRKDAGRYRGEFIIDAMYGGSGEADRMEIFEPIAQEKLFPLGMVYDQFFLYVGESKKIYMGATTELYLLGDGIEDFLNNIVLGHFKPEKIKTY